MTAVLERPAVRAPEGQPLPDRRPLRSGTPFRERVVVGVALLVVGVAHSLNLAGWPRYWDDEGTYYSQAWSVEHLGSLSPYTYWYDHPPVGWLQMALFTWIPDLLGGGANSAVLSGRVVMVAYTVVTALLVHLLARRLGMPLGWAVLAMLFWALNPLVLFMSRQVFLDNVALPWLVGAFVLVLGSRKHLGAHMAAGLCFGMAVLSKETTLMFAPALLLALWQSAYRPTRAFAMMGFSTIVAAAGSLYLLFAAIRSELFPGPDHVSLWDALAFQFMNRASSGSILDADGPEGGAYTTFHSWLSHDSGVLLLGGVAAAVLALAVRRLRAVAIAVLTAALVAMRPEGYLPQMYVVAMLPFCALAVVGVLHAVWARLRRLRNRPLRVVASATMLAGLVAAALPFADWRHNYEAAWSEDANDVHAAAVDYVAREIPRDATVVTDNSYWNDLVDRGWDPAEAVWFYKADSDDAITERIGGDYQGIDYVVWSIDIAENQLPIVSDAYDHSELLWAQGEGRERVEVRRVLTQAEEAQIQAAEEARAAAQLETERRERDAFMAEPSAEFLGLTNGQVAGIRAERDTFTATQLADKYDTTEATIAAVLAGGDR
jgi:hypothetical protein